MPEGVATSGLLLPSTLSRRGLSEVVNHLLELDEAVPFDFLIELPALADDRHAEKVFLRTSLQRLVRSWYHHDPAGLWSGMG